MELFIIIPIAVFGVLFFYVVATFNTFQTIKIRIEEAWSGIDVQLKRRTDLIPNLVETVKGYASHEKEVFENVTKAREALIAAKGPEDSQNADNMLSAALKSVFAIAEAYPDLKASQNFMQLQSELSDTETKIAYSRQFYNTNVREFNTLLMKFPSNVIGRILNFSQKSFFEATEEEKQPVKVAF